MNRTFPYRYASDHFKPSIYFARFEMMPLVTRRGVWRHSQLFKAVASGVAERNPAERTHFFHWLSDAAELSCLG